MREDAFVYCLSCRAHSFFRCCTDNTVHIEGLKSFLFRKMQFVGILACSNLSFKFSGLIGFYQNIFEAHDIEDKISGPNSIVMS